MLSIIKIQEYKNVEIKVNFFCDFFNLMVRNIGRYNLWDFENPLSLVDKIIFQIENNPENRVRYLTNHLSSHHLNSNGFTNQFKYLKKLSPLINHYNSIIKDKEKNDWIINNPIFLRILKKLKTELEVNMAKVAISFITNYLMCTHDLDFHKEDFKYLARIVVSDLKFNDKSDKETQRLIRKILSKKSTEVPLPISILNKRNQDNYSDIVSNFISNRTFTQQIEGILNFKEQKNEEGFYLVRIFKLTIPENEVIEFENMEIRHPNNIKFEKIFNGRDKEFWGNFTLEKDISIGIIKGNISNHNQGFKQAVKNIQSVLDFVNVKLGLNSYLDMYEFYTTIDFKKTGFSISSKNSELSQNSLDRLKGDNPHILLEHVNSEAKTKFISAEKIYRRASASNEVSDYWHYLECLIPNKLDSRGKYKKQVKTASANILMLKYKSKFPENIAICIFNLLNTHSRKRTKNSLSYKEIQEISLNWRNSEVMQKSIKFKNHPIINELHELYSNRNDVNKLNEEYQYNTSILNELYEIRNAYVHGGKTNKYADKKMQSIIPPLITSIRQIILQEIKKNRLKTMDKIIATLIRKAEEYRFR